MKNKNLNYGMDAKDAKVIIAEANLINVSRIPKTLLAVKSKLPKLNEDEVEMMAKLVNVKCHSTFSMFDVQSYFKKLNDSKK
jgi:hypothetical protein